VRIRSKRKNQRAFGETITYQCHAIREEIVDPSSVYKRTKQVSCLSVVQVTTTCNYWLRPGYFTESDFDWSKVSFEAPVVTENTSFVVDSLPLLFDFPEEAPPNPWTRRTVRSKVLWDAFWELALEGD